MFWCVSFQQLVRFPVAFHNPDPGSFKLICKRGCLLVDVLQETTYLVFLSMCCTNLNSNFGTPHSQSPIQVYVDITMRAAKDGQPSLFCLAVSLQRHDGQIKDIQDVCVCVSLVPLGPCLIVYIT